MSAAPRRGRLAPSTPAVADDRYLTREKLLSAPIHEDGEDVVLPSGVGTVRVRALNRIEGAGAMVDGNMPETEMRIAALGLVAPVMTLAQVREWFRTSPAGDPAAVVSAIDRLSNGTREPKEWTKSLPQG